MDRIKNFIDKIKGKITVDDFKYASKEGVLSLLFGYGMPEKWATNVSKEEVEDYFYSEK